MTQQVVKIVSYPYVESRSYSKPKRRIIHNAILTSKVRVAGTFVKYPNQQDIVEILDTSVRAWWIQSVIRDSIEYPSRLKKLVEECKRRGLKIKL